MLCPRCQLSLQPQTYEGQEVRFCGDCWGHWMRREQLEAIIADRSTKFTRGEREAVARDVRAAEDEAWFDGESAVVACPDCGAAMQKAKYDESYPIVIDVCPEHGLWLDHGEMKELQILLE